MSAFSGGAFVSETSFEAQRPALVIALAPGPKPGLPHHTATSVAPPVVAPRAAPSVSPTPSAVPTLTVPDAVHPAIWIFFAVLVIAAVANAWRITRHMPRRDETAEERAQRLRIFSVLVTYGAAAFAMGRAFIVPSGAKQTYVPNLDLTTLAWVLLSVFGLLIPVIAEIGIGSFFLRLKPSEAQELAQRVIPKLQKLMTDWCMILNEYAAESRARREPSWDRLTQFVQARLSEAAPWSAERGGAEPDTPPRLIVWIANAQTRELTFGWCNRNVADTELVKTTFRPGEGIAGQAFAEHRIRNEVHPRNAPGFKDFPDVPYPFESMLVVPIDSGSQRLGVLCVDRMLAESFDELAIAPNRALAAVLGIVLALHDEAMKHSKKPGGLGKRRETKPES